MSIFETLMSLPLFKGVSRETLERTVGKFRFDFKKYSDGKRIAKAGDECRSLVFILSGRVELRTEVMPGLIIRQVIDDKSVLAPEFLFGLSTVYPGTATAVGDVNVLEILKSDYLSILSSDNIFLLNYINMLSRKGQRRFEDAERLTDGSIAGRIAVLVDSFTDTDASEIVIESTDLPISEIFNISGSRDADEMGMLKASGVIDFDDRRIRVIDRHRLVK